MGLVHCQECKREISDRCEECVGCGAPKNIYLGNSSASQNEKSPALESEKESMSEDPEAPESNVIDSNRSVPESKLLVDQSDIELKEDYQASVENVKFDKNDPKYRAIKYTNVLMFVLLYILEIGQATIDGRSTASPIPVFITYWIARAIIRHYFNERTKFRNASAVLKVAISIAIWITSFVVKFLVALILLNVFL